jgi:hypothetical protein
MIDLIKSSTAVIQRDNHFARSEYTFDASGDPMLQRLSWKFRTVLKFWVRYVLGIGNRFHQCHSNQIHDETN